ncbi:MAG: NADH-quinone oxidoreductase subunit NuoF [Proteobacteria bacterium]|nr:NADH-quinone oxidoreductase subunit NuoF [Cystobacterineae bacterium]MCL2258335.1 NADH-quinone oxidoreductase subunit NuoF [Cystobacterineae bacterium]MCL2315360.1 NADH-quinone oxidoreductase subunit NuoF [Pseudomonadota bacterium]
MSVPFEKVISRNWDKPAQNTLVGYKRADGYKTLQKVLSSLSPQQIVDEVKKSNLRGRGGAGFPTGVKWGFVPKDSPKPKYLCVNADESEPGTAKDRYILERDPHLLLEGVAIACWALGVHTCYIYARGEFKHPSSVLDRAIAEAYADGIFGRKLMNTSFALDVYQVRGAGAYVCGEETALLESLEGKKGWPRLKPPFPAVVGLFGCPTVVNNVETIAALPRIFEKGAAWFASLGSEKSGGTRLITLSGSVNRPGTYEAPMQATIEEIIFSQEYGQGMPEGRKPKAVIPGGSSAPVLTASEIGVSLDFDAYKPLNSMAGSGGIIVIDDATCIVRALWRVTRFYAEESCGQCTPCREGQPWMTRLLRKIEEGHGQPEDLDTLMDVASAIAPWPPVGLGNTVCALGDAGALPVQSFVTKFREEFVQHISEQRCPYGDKPWGTFGDFK